MGACIGKKHRYYLTSVCKIKVCKNNMQTGMICSPSEPRRRATDDTENVANNEQDASFDKVIRILPLFEMYSQGTGKFIYRLYRPKHRFGTVFDRHSLQS